MISLTGMKFRTVFLNESGRYRVLGVISLEDYVPTSTAGGNSPFLPGAWTKNAISNIACS